LDTIITVDSLGVGVHKPVELWNVAADSSYFEIIKTVTGSPDLDLVPPPEYILEDIFSGEDWIKKDEANQAPSTALNSTQETSIIYTYYDEKTTMIEGVEYTARQGTKEVKQKPLIETGENQVQFSEWINFAKSDSPDNYPGGREGQTPYSTPALNRDGTEYVFPYESQLEYEEEMKTLVVQNGGECVDGAYRIKLGDGGVRSRVLEPRFVFSLKCSSRQSTVTTSWYGSRESGETFAGNDFS